MPRDVVAIGGSAGGVEVLKRLVQDLPADLPATVLVALHLPATARSLLADLLARRTALKVVEAADGMPLEHGVIAVARPDHHLLVLDDEVVLGRGGRENGYRPSHDAMLRSVALARRERAVGVVLTGLLDDGSAGLHVVSRYGGACLVQDPADAEFPSMPEHALAAVPDARPVRLADLAQEVTRTVTEPTPHATRDIEEDLHRLDLAELGSALGRSPGSGEESPLGPPSPYACPDCSGVLNHVPDTNTVRFRCRTGHAWTAESLLHQQAQDVEGALFTALRILEERIEITRRLASESGEHARAWSQEHYRQRADEAERHAEVIRNVLDRHVETEDSTAAALG